MSGKSNVLVTLPAGEYGISYDMLVDNFSFFTGCEVPKNVEIEINCSQNPVDVLVSSIMYIQYAKGGRAT